MKVPTARAFAHTEGSGTEPHALGCFYRMLVLLMSNSKSTRTRDVPITLALAAQSSIAAAKPLVNFMAATWYVSCLSNSELCDV